MSTDASEAGTQRRWSALMALPVVLGALVFSGAVSAVAAAIRSGSETLPAHRDGVVGVALHGTPPLLTLIGTLAQDAGLVAGAVLVAALAMKGRFTAAHLGLHAARYKLAGGLVAGGYVLFLVLSVAWTSALGITDHENLAVQLGTRDSGAALAGATLLTCVVAPVCEELFFRGFLFGALRRRGVIVATVVTGLAFGAAHVASAPIGFIVPLAALGMILCLIYERTGSLYPCMALHALNNAVAFGVGDGRTWLIPVGLAAAALAVFALARAVRLPRVFRPLALSVLALALLAAPAAHAQGPPLPPTPTTPTTPAPAPAPAPAPVAAKISLDLEHVGHASRPVAFTHKAIRVRGTVIPYVAGQQVHVRFYRGGSIAHAVTVKVAAPRQGKTGKFVVDYRPKVTGRIRVGVRHPATPQMAFAHARTPAVEVIGRHASLGDHDNTVRVMQILLRHSGYVPGTGGRYTEKTGRAVLAFRKMSGLPRLTFASYKVLRRLVAGGGRFRVRFPHQGRHAEGDLTHQVLALIDGSKVERLYPISSGKPSTPTVLGTFRVYQRTPGYLPDGMYYSSFFTGGYAIHGYDPSPTYPASHGCMRTPIADAVSIYDWLAFGDYVDTYYRTGLHRHPKPSKHAGP